MKPFGRNQLIACAGYGVTFAVSVAFVFAGKVTGSEWLSFAQIFMPVAVSTVIGSSAIVKSIGLIKNGQKTAG